MHPFLSASLRLDVGTWFLSVCVRVRRVCLPPPPPLPWLSDTDIWYVGGWQMLVIAGKLYICMRPLSQDFQIDNEGKSFLSVGEN